MSICTSRSSQTRFRVLSCNWTATRAAGRPRLGLALRSDTIGRHNLHTAPYYSAPLPLHVSRGMLKSSITFNRVSSIQRHLTMDTQELKNFLAESVIVSFVVMICRANHSIVHHQVRSIWLLNLISMPWQINKLVMLISSAGTYGTSTRWPALNNVFSKTACKTSEALLWVLYVLGGYKTANTVCMVGTVMTQIHLVSMLA